MVDYLIDFETRSSLPISVGTERYLRTSQSDIICMSWCRKGSSNVQLWIPGRPLPFLVGPKDKVYAFNIQFDQRVWNYLGPKYGFIPLPIEKCVDVMAIAGRYGYPQKLELLGRVLNLKLQKNPIGKKLMKKICSPPFKYTVEDLSSFFQYCKDDTASMAEALRKLPADQLSPEEQAVWLMTVKLNRRGLPIDLRSVAAIALEINRDTKKAEEELYAYTEGALERYTLVKRIQLFCKDCGVDLPNLTKDTVQQYLDAGGLPEQVEYVLKGRKKYGKTSVSKYSRLLEQTYNGRVYDNHRYYGGHTGRFAGLSFQIHNMYRGEKGVDYTEQINNIIRRQCADVVGTARSLIRPMIKAPKGRKLVVADYKSIENVLLAMVSGEDWVLQLYLDGKDEYKAMAVDLYNVTYPEVTGEQRTVCKPVVLGAGYGLAWRGLLSYADGFGVELTDVEAQTAIQVYRQTHPMVVQLWYGAQRAFLNALCTPGQEFQYRTVTFKMVKDRTGTYWMKMTLPSGRAMFYNSPKIVDGMFGESISAMMTDSKTKQWIRREISPGHLTENIIQACARDVLVHGKFRLLEAGYDVLASVHDEIIAEVDERWDNLDHFYSEMCHKESWYSNLPLFAEGKIVNRYQKI